MAAAPGARAMVLPLDVAMARWSETCASWNAMAAGSAPALGAFLAGWYCRCIGASRPEDEGMFRESFRAGWREADAQIAIESRAAAANGGEEHEPET